MTIDIIINALLMLVVTVDPIGNVPLFIGLTKGMHAAERRRIARRGTLIAFALLSLFAITGSGVLDLMGITLPAFRVAGGLLLFYLAFEMLYGHRQERRAKASDAATRDHIANIAVFPLAIPLLAGPGTISATVLLSDSLGNTWPEARWMGLLVLLGLIAAVMLVAATVLSLSNIVDRLLGETGRLIMTRLLGVLLAALSVQFVADGITAMIAAA
ncbi:MAG: MarC family transcriptional regulator [Gammaproteobacteria bacterium]|nr:MAG: MarC family transcriptional regulator [Gammaproteobacteria bacterium]